MSTVRQILQNKGTAAWSVTPQATVFQALELMAAKDIGAVLVIDAAGKLAGIFSERDYARKVILKGLTSKSVTVGELMATKLLVVSPDVSINECMQLMTARRTRHLPVVENGKLVGVVTIGDVVKNLISDHLFTIEQLERYVYGPIHPGELKERLSMWPDLLIEIVKISCVIVGLLLIVAYTVLLERRVAAWIQDRIGPNRAGPQGLLQPIADFMKLILKEDLLPSFVNKPYFMLAPALVMVPSLLAISVIPWGSQLGNMPCVIADLDVGLLFVFAITSLTVYGIVLAGWSSNSPYSFIGGIRSSAQLISYEVCLGLSAVGLILQTGTLNLGSIVTYQAQHGWLVLTQPVGFLVFLVSSFAETNRAPFDFPEAEQELVGGYHTEYSSMKFALFFLGEYSNMTISSALMATLFFGGWSLPFAPFNAPATSIAVGLAHIGIFLLKLLCFLFFFIWVRWTLPRFRYDQLMRIGWNVMLPLALANALFTAARLALWGTPS